MAVGISKAPSTISISTLILWIDNSLSVPTPADATDSAEISKLAKSDNVAGLSASAPIDYDQVNAIKNAIANGDYPIDADRIADALMDVYREMKN